MTSGSSSPSRATRLGQQSPRVLVPLLGDFLGHLRKQRLDFPRARVRIHDLFEHPARVHPERMGGRVDLAIRDDLDAVVLDFADDLRRMDCGDELAARKRGREVVNDLPL